MVIGWGFGTHRGASAAPGMWQIGAGLRLMRQARPGVLANDLAACNAWKGKRKSLPHDLILGAADRMTPAKAGRALAERSQVLGPLY